MGLSAKASCKGGEMIIFIEGATVLNFLLTFVLVFGMLFATYGMYLIMDDDYKMKIRRKQKENKNEKHN